MSVLHSSSSSLNTHLHGLTVVGGSKEQDTQQQQQQQKQQQQQQQQQQHHKILRGAGVSTDVSALSDDFQQ